MRIAVIVPFTRPNMAPNVQINFHGQTYANKFLVMVTNGFGVGSFGGADILCERPDVLNKSDALNAGVDAARKAGADLFAVFDDDDVYGPGYLTEVARCASKACASGIPAFSYQAPDGSHWRVPGRTDAVVTEGLHGGTLAGRLDLPPFRAVAFAEEVLWCRDLQRQGHTMYARRPLDFLHRRFSAPEHRHTFPLHPSTADMLPSGDP